MKRLLLAVACTLAATAAHADDISSGKIQVRIPNGWTVQKLDDSDGIAIVSPRRSPMALCFLASIDAPETVGLSQEQANALLDQIVDEEFWRGSYEKLNAKSVTLQKTTSTVRAGRKIAIATVRFVVEVKDSTAKDAFQIVPGRGMLVDCMTETSVFPADEPDFDVVINSFGPLGGDVIAGLPRPDATLSYNPANRVESLKQRINEARRRLRALRGQ